MQTIFRSRGVQPGVLNIKYFDLRHIMIVIMLGPETSYHGHVK